MSTASIFSAGTACEPCKVKGHFCQAADFNADDDPACQPCISGQPCSQQKARMADFDGPPLPPNPGLKNPYACDFCGKRRHPGTCAQRRAAMKAGDAHFSKRVKEKLREKQEESQQNPEAITPPEAAAPGVMSTEESRDVIGRFESGALANVPFAEPDPMPEPQELEPQPDRDVVNRTLVDALIEQSDGEVVDVASMTSRYHSVDLDRKIQRAMSCPPGKGLRYVLTVDAAKRLYDRLRQRINSTKQAAAVRLDKDVVYLYRKES